MLFVDKTKILPACFIVTVCESFTNYFGILELMVADA